MNLYLPGLEPDPAPAPALEKRPTMPAPIQPRHPDAVGLSSLPEARATVAALDLACTDFPHQRALLLLVAGRAYRLTPSYLLPSLYELVSKDGKPWITAVWQGRDLILSHLAAERDRERAQQLALTRARIISCYDEQGRAIDPDNDLVRRAAALLLEASQ